MIYFDPSQLSSQQQGLIEQFSGNRRFNELLPGERFKAMILDIRPGQVTIKFEGGGTFTARSMVLPEARIGEEALFIVKENDTKGHILLEMGKLTPEARQDNMLREALRHAGMTINEETLNLGRAMLNNNVPVDANSLQKAAFYHFTPTDGNVTPLESVIFLLNENFPAEQTAVNAFNRTAKQPEILLKNINQIMDAIVKAPAEEAEILLQALFRGGDAPKKVNGETLPAILSMARKKLILPLYAGKEELLPSLRSYFKELRGTFERLTETAAAQDIKGALPEAAANARDVLQTMRQINLHREYYQIPFAVSPQGPARQADLFVFKDKKKSEGANRTYSALIALDTTGLKHTEVYIQKTGGQTFLTFRCDTDRALTVLSAAGARLTQALKEKNIPVGSMAFNKITEPFLLTSPEPYTEPPKQENIKRYAFDMRV